MNATTAVNLFSRLQENIMPSRRTPCIKSRFTTAPLAVLVVAALIGASAVPSQGQIPTPNILYTFQQATTDVAAPSGVVAQGRDGNLYGTGAARGANSQGGVFKITPAGAETLLVSFPSTWPGYSCAQGLTLANDGNFYGACYLGGANSSGFIYRVTPTGVLTDIYDFTGTTGGVPLGAPVLGADGNLYGSTGANSGQAQVIYRISTSGVYKLLYTMANGNSIPSFLSAGSDGNFYGTVATADGFGNVGGVFRINSAGTFTLINGFVTSTGVYYPNSGVILATNGKLYGTTAPTSGTGDGTIYDVTAAGVVTDLFNMGTTTPLNGGYNNLLQASDGNFYGASEGGGNGNMGGPFELTSANVYSSYVYSDQTITGAYPQTPLMQHTNGTIFGANSSGGPNFGEGTFFSLNIGAGKFISLVTPVAAGKEGAQVGILGQGFSKTSVVKFGGVAATKTVPSGSTFILATVPAGALTGTVTVTTGTTTLSTKATYKITPTILSFSPTSGHVGASVTITGTGLTQTTKVTFNNVSASFTVNSDTQITATVPTGATTGKIGVVTKGGTAVSATNFTVN